MKNVIKSLLIIFLLALTSCTNIEKAEALYNKGDKEAALNMAISLLDKDEPGVRLRAVRLIGKV